MGQGAALHVTGHIGVAVGGAGRRLNVIHPLMIGIGGGIRGIGNTLMDLADPNIAAGLALEGDLLGIALVVNLDVMIARAVQIPGLGKGRGGVAAELTFIGLGLTMLTGAFDCFVGDLHHIIGQAVRFGRIVVFVGTFVCECSHRHDGSHHGNDQQPGDNTNQAFFHFLFPPLVYTHSLITVLSPGAQLQRLPPVLPVLLLLPEAESILT